MRKTTQCAALILTAASMSSGLIPVNVYAEECDPVSDENTAVYSDAGVPDAQPAVQLGEAASLCLDQFWKLTSVDAANAPSVLQTYAQFVKLDLNEQNAFLDHCAGHPLVSPYQAALKAVNALNQLDENAIDPAIKDLGAALNLPAITGVPAAPEQPETPEEVEKPVDPSENETGKDPEKSEGEPEKDKTDEEKPDDDQSDPEKDQVDQPSEESREDKPASDQTVAAAPEAKPENTLNPVLSETIKPEPLLARAVNFALLPKGEDKKIEVKKMGWFQSGPDFTNEKAWKKAQTNYNTPYLWGQCTWFAWGRFYEIYGFNPGFTGNGNQCVGQLLYKHGDLFEKSKEPKAGAVFSGDAEHNHVGIVLDVDDDGMITIQEGNMDGVSNSDWEVAIQDWRTIKVSLEDLRVMYGDVIFANPIEGKVEFVNKPLRFKSLRERALIKLSDNTADKAEAASQDADTNLQPETPTLAARWSRMLGMNRR